MHRIEAYITLAFIELVVVSIVYLPIFIYLKRKEINFIRQTSYILVSWSIITIVYATIFFVMPITFMPKQYMLNLIPFNWLFQKDSIRYFVTEILPNIMMVIPLGFFLPSVFEKIRKLWKVVLVIIIGIFSIEIFQFFIGRSCDVDDFIANVLGGIIGFVIFMAFNYVFKNKKSWKKFIGIVK